MELKMQMRSEGMGPPGVIWLMISRVWTVFEDDKAAHLGSVPQALGVVQSQQSTILMCVKPWVPCHRAEIKRARAQLSLF